MISLCMVVHNNAPVLSRAIDSAKDLVNEIVIVDQDSTDKTGEIAQSYADIYIKKRMKGNADPDREYCAAMARGEWLLWLDGDEYLSEALQKRIPKVAVDEFFDIYWIKFQNFIDGINIQSIMGDDWHPRLYKKGSLVWSPQAHTYPETKSPLQAWVEQPIVHDREWKQVKEVHKIRSKCISLEAQEAEAKFLTQVEEILKHGKKK